MSKTPVYDFVKKYRAEKARFHMPAHKGKGKIEIDDITEIDGADVLYRPSGIIAESERIASGIFGSGATFYSVEGSSLAIRAAVYLACGYAKKQGRAPVIAAARNVHSSFISACALCGADPVWLYGSGKSLLSYTFDKTELLSVLTREKPVAVYVTSPDYLGNRANIAELAEACHANDALLIVDNAHGAYLKFVGENAHPLDAGADICVESAHKTLPCLTGTAYLHLGKSAPDFLVKNANFALNLFASTSPSYLLIASLDRFNGVADDYAAKVKLTAERVGKLKAKLISRGYSLVGNEPLKITISTKSYGYLGFDIAGILADNRIIAEFYDKDFITFMFSPSNKRGEINRLEKTLLSIMRKTLVTEKPPVAARCERVLSVREATFADFEEVNVENAEGKVLAGLTLFCPPAVPVAVCGERLNSDAINALRYYDISTVRVVK